MFRTNRSVVILRKSRLLYVGKDFSMIDYGQQLVNVGWDTLRRCRVKLAKHNNHSDVLPQTK